MLLCCKTLKSVSKTPSPTFPALMPYAMTAREAEPNHIEVVAFSTISEMGFPALCNNAPEPAQQECNKSTSRQPTIAKSHSSISISFLWNPKWIQVIWVLGHCKLPSNGLADEQAKICSSLPWSNSQLDHHHACSWSTMECSEPAAWIMNWSLLVAFCAKPSQEDRPFQAWLYPELHTRKAVWSAVVSVSLRTQEFLRQLPTCDQLPQLCPACIPFPNQPTIAMTNYTHAPTGD